MTVCPSGCVYSSIQSAIDTSNSGDIINVNNGEYHEKIIIDKALKLQGEDKNNTIINGGGNGHVVLITANNSVFKGFKVINSGSNPSGSPYNGVRLMSVNNSNVSNNNVSNNDHGIALWKGSNNNLIENNSVFFNNVGIVIADNSNTNTILKNNASYNFYHGINPYLNSDNNSIISNTVLNNGYYGITPSSAHDNIITENFISGNTYGIYSYSYYTNSSGNKIYRNDINGNINQAYDDSGLNFWDNGTVGNHWSDHDDPTEGCYDVDRNGICDSTYLIPISTVDNYPLVSMDLNTTPIPEGYGYICGSVLNGTGIVNAIVTANNSNSTTTDVSGLYTLLVPAGIYNLKVTKEPEYYSNSPLIINVISGTTTVQNIELLKKQTGNITGSVTAN